MIISSISTTASPDENKRKPMETWNLLSYCCFLFLIAILSLEFSRLVRKIEMKERKTEHIILIQLCLSAYIFRT